MIKILLCTFIVFCAMPARATEMCANEDTIVIPMPKNIQIKSGGNDTKTGVFWWDTQFGRFYGEGVFLSEAEGGEPSGGRGTYTNSNGEILSSDIGISGISPGSKDAYGNVRKYGWCRLTHPVKTLWVYTDNSYTGKWYPGQLCGNFFNPAYITTGVFESVGMNP